MARKPKTDLLAHLFTSLRGQAAERRKTDQWSDKAGVLRALLMPNQAVLERDPSARIAVRSARRCGKSTGAMFLVGIRCLERSGSAWVVIGLTRPSVKRIYWLALQQLNQEYELGIKFQHQELVATFPNGSRVYFVGAENRGEIEKLRGGKYDGVILDESKSFSTSVFDELLYDVIEPALMDRRGQLILIGTPGDVLAGPFFLATTDDQIVLETPGGKRLSNCPHGQAALYPAIWSLHSWTLQDNTTKFTGLDGVEYTLWGEALKKKALYGWGDDHPTWMREYLGKWVANDVRIVYRYRPHLHDYLPCHDSRFGIPGDKSATWKTCIGFDLGSKDGTAVVVWAYSDTEPGLWELYSERRLATPETPLNVDTIAEWYHELAETYGPFSGDTCDGAGLGLMVMDSLAARGVYLEPAEKRAKNDHIELFNTDLDRGFIHVRQGSTLSAELLENRWLERTVGTERKVEDPKTVNDTCDAALYAFRWCRHRDSRPKTPAEPMFTRAWYAKVAAQELLAAEARARKQHEPAVIDTDWWNS